MQYSQFGSLYLAPPAYPETGGFTTHDWQLGWMDNRHPKLKEFMNPYLEKFNGRIHLAELLDAAGKRQSNFPMLPKLIHPNKQPFHCWNSTLACSMFRECKYMHAGSHPKPGDIPDTFAGQCIDVLGKGVVAQLQEGTNNVPGKTKD
jgi:hypothetical protein